MALSMEMLIRFVLGQTRCDAPVPLVLQFVNRRLGEYAGRQRLRTYRANRALYLPASVTAGLLSATRDSTTLILDVTAQIAWNAAIVLDPDFPQGWFVRPRVGWYAMISLVGGTVTLDTRFAETTVTSVSYVLAKRYHALPTDIVWLDPRSFVHARFGQSLIALNQGELDQQRSLTSTGVPHYVSEVEATPTGARQLEIFPAPLISEMLTYGCWTLPPLYTITDTIPAFIHEDTFIPGLLADLYKWKANQPDLSVEEKQHFQNIAARETTLWEAALEHAMLRSQGLEQRAFILAGSRGTRRSHDIRTAYDDIWSRP